MTGILGSANLYGDVPQSIYVCDTENGAIITLNICNKTTTPAFVSVAISDDMNAPTNAEWVEYQTEIKPNGILERSGIALDQGQFLTVKSSNTNTNAICWGVTSGDSIEVESIVTNLTGPAPIWITASILSDIYAGELTSIQLNAADANGVSYSLTSGSLPSGLSLNSSSGIISGTPITTGYSPSGVADSFTVTATDGMTQTTNRTFSITKRWKDGSNATSAATSIANLKSYTTTNGVYWLKNGVSGTPYQTYCLFDSVYDSGGWELAYNINANNTTSMIGGIPHWDNGSFWLNANEWEWQSTTPWSTNVKTRTFDQRGITEVLIVLHNTGGYAQASARGWSVYSNTRQTGKSFLTLHTQGTDIKLSTGGRKTWANYAGNLTWNNRRPQTRGGDIFIDGTVNGFNNASDDLVINATGYWGSLINTIRLGTTAGETNTTYGHTFAGIGIRHSFSGWGFYYAMAPVTSYCEPPAVYGNQNANGFNQASSPDSGNLMLTACDNRGWANGFISCGYAVFVR